jgi:hypothetical protein
VVAIIEFCRPSRYPSTSVRKATRTAEAVVHVQEAYNALADWYAHPDMGNGRKPYRIAPI